MRFSFAILGLQMGKEGSKRLCNIIVIIQSFLQLGMDVVFKIKPFAAISWPILAIPAVASNLVDQILWCQGFFLYAACAWGSAILMSSPGLHVSIVCVAPSCPGKALPQNSSGYNFRLDISIG